MAKGIDPGLIKQATKRSSKLADANSFETIAREWHAKFLPKWTMKHAERLIHNLEKDIFPWIGKRIISEITPPELLKVLQRIESRGAIETRLESRRY